MLAKSSRANRRIVLAGVAACVSALVVGCAGQQPAEDDSVDFDNVQDATIQIQAEGTFVAPGTTEPASTAGRGSGFIINESGLAVTNNHVVVGAGRLDVWIGGDPSAVGARILGASECLDLAVLDVDGDGLPHYGWYEGEIKVALDVYSAGFPLGDPNFTMTRGIVSKADVPQEDSWASLDHVIEHDARIRGGNSGGPLVAPNGKVVGVNYAGDDELDYNFAIHRDQVLPVLEDLAAGKPVLSLGVNAQALSPADDGTPQGIWVSSVQAGGPADEAGIEAGDVLLDLAGVVLAQNGSLEEYCEVISTQGTDTTIDVTVFRPSDGGVYEGQFNGDEIEYVSDGNQQSGTVGSFVTVGDDSQTISVSIPDTWADISGAPTEGSNGQQFLNLTASPNIAEYNGTWNTPGLSISVTEDLTSYTIADYLDGYSSGVGAECSYSDPGDYDDGFYVGDYLYFSGCGGTDTDFVVLATNDVDNTHLLLLTIQMVDETDKSLVLDEILGSFQAIF